MELAKYTQGIELESIGNNSYVVAKKDIPKFLSNIISVTLVDRSYFGEIDYFLADRNPYNYGKASFQVEGEKVYIISSISTCYLLSLNDSDFETLRINHYGENIELLFDFCINGSYSRKCLHIDAGGTAAKNNEISKEIQQYRQKYYTDRIEGLKHLRKAKALRGISDDFYVKQSVQISGTKNPLSDYKGQVYCLSKKKNNVLIMPSNAEIDAALSLKPHPMPYDQLEKLRKAIKSIHIPGVFITGGYMLPVPEEVFLGKKWVVYIIYIAMEGFDKESIMNILRTVVNIQNPEIHINLFKEDNNDLCKFLISRKHNDLYNVFGGYWISDHLEAKVKHKNEDVESDTEESINETTCNIEPEIAELKLSERQKEKEQTALFAT